MSLIERIYRQRGLQPKQPAATSQANDPRPALIEGSHWNPLDLDLSAPSTSADTSPASSRRIGTDETRMPAPALPHERVDRPNTVAIDLARLRDQGFVTPGTTRSSIAEHFGQIKRPLLTNARTRRTPGDRLSLVMITSALPREGKTFCAVNLAISLSFEIDTSVLLVDADVMRPALLQRLGLKPERGLLDLLTDRQLTLSDVVLKTNIPKLSILPAGLPTNMSSELLASDAMDALLLTLAAMDPNRIVIFDAPPLLVTTEAKVLASRIGQIVVVVAASDTPRSALVPAFELLADCPIVMSVLNKAPTAPVPLGYGYED